MWEHARGRTLTDRSRMQADSEQEQDQNAADQEAAPETDPDGQPGLDNWMQ